MVKSDSIEEGIKALYAVSALTRNNLASQELFYAEAGGLMLQVNYLSFNNIVNIVIFF
jgi:nucleotide exchange factor SIL1